LQNGVDGLHFGSALCAIAILFKFKSIAVGIIGKALFLLDNTCFVQFCVGSKATQQVIVKLFGFAVCVAPACNIAQFVVSQGSCVIAQREGF